jgi:pyruvate formate lyase activating enzyme
MSVDEVLAEVRKDEVFYRQSGGGVTFSGGEPLLQKKFLGEILRVCKAHDLHTTVDTCGMGRLEDLLDIAPYADLFLYDLKLMDDARHLRHTGVSNRVILENLQALGKVHECIWVRIPVIPGINDAPEDLEAAARFAARVSGVKQVNLLPFHRACVSKQERLGQASPVAKLEPPGADAMDAAIKIFSKLGLRAIAGG